MGVEDGRDWWDCHLGLDPAPPPGTRWLEVGPGAQGQRVRIDLARPPGRAPTLAEPVPPASPAARLLDQMGDDLLTLETASPRGQHPDGAPGDAGHPEPDRIGHAARRRPGRGASRGTRLAARPRPRSGRPGPGPRAAPRMDQPAGRRAAHDGPDAVAPFAADLPEIDGARFALAGLRSSADGATLHVMASGWEPRGHGWLMHGSGPGDIPPDLSLSWRARDSTGRWHLVSGMSWGAASQTRGMIKMYLTPPLHPAATALDVFVTGPHHQVQATVPLRWAGGGSPPASPERPAVSRIPRQRRARASEAAVVGRVAAGRGPDPVRPRGARAPLGRRAAACHGSRRHRGRTGARRAGRR